MQEKSTKRVKKIEPLDKSDWKKLDEEEVYNLKVEGTWVQKGPYIINTSSELEYAIYVGNNTKLVGFDEKGVPILESM